MAKSCCPTLGTSLAAAIALDKAFCMPYQRRWVQRWIAYDVFDQNVQRHTILTKFKHVAAWPTVSKSIFAVAHHESLLAEPFAIQTVKQPVLKQAFT